MEERRGRFLRRSLVVLLCGAVLLFGGLEAVVLAGSRTTIKGTPSAMVILGANLWDGEPSPVLKARLDAALEYLEVEPDLPVVVTGGQGEAEPESEAACMARYLEDRGLDPERILQETEAANTLQNLSFSAALLEDRGLPSEELLVVSNGPHLARVRLLGRRCGLNVSCLAAPTPGGWSYRLYFYGREAAALVKSWVFDRSVPPYAE